LFANGDELNSNLPKFARSAYSFFVVVVVFFSSRFLALGRLIIFLEENSQYFCILQLRLKKKKRNAIPLKNALLLAPDHPLQC